MKKRACRTAWAALLLTVLLCRCGVVLPARAGSPAVTTVEDLVAALAAAEEGDVITVGDISFRPMPTGVIQIPVGVTLRAQEGGAVFRDATFALYGTGSDAAPLRVRFENITFRGNAAGEELDPEAPPEISSTMPGFLQTQCAAVLQQNVDAVWSGCTFEGYHYGYGGVISAIYSTADNREELHLTLEDCVFRGNAAGRGGAIYLAGYDHNITLDACGCRFEGNGAARGGAIWAQKARIRLSECDFSDQCCIRRKEDCLGGALCLENCDALLNGCLFAGNESAGAGGAVFCGMTPFHTFNVINSTFTGNTAPDARDICPVVRESNLTTPTLAHLYFCSFAGGDAGLSTSGSVDAFACFFAGEEERAQQPSADNGWCLHLPQSEAESAGYLAAENGHIVAPASVDPVPAQDLAAVCAGKFAGSLGVLRPGDNYASEGTITVKERTGRSVERRVGYGETLVLEAPERRGFTLRGWDLSDGGESEGRIYLGGETAGVTASARWKWTPRVSSVLLLAGGVLALAFFAGVLLRRRKAVPTAGPETTVQSAPEEWIERVCASESAACLSAREREVLRGLLEGKRREEIAGELFISESTVKKHASSIYAKLGVKSRVELLSRFSGT